MTNRTPKYGNDDDYADEIMEKVFEFYRKSVTGRRNNRGGTYRINMLPTTCHVYFGDVMIASPNGVRTEDMPTNRYQREFHRKKVRM